MALRASGVTDVAAVVAGAGAAESGAIAKRRVAASAGRRTPRRTSVTP
jgi:hypothetical protein